MENLVGDWTLDPSRMPKRLELELSEEVYAVLAELSQRTGRPMRDLAEALIAQAVKVPLPPQQSCQD